MTAVPSLFPLGVLFIHLYDEYLWGLLEKEETWEAAEMLLKEMAEVLFLSLKESVSMQDDYMKSMEHLLVYAVIERVCETLEETASKETHADVGA